MKMFNLGYPDNKDDNFIKRPLFLIGLSMLATMIVSINITGDTALMISVVFFVIALLCITNIKPLTIKYKYLSLILITSSLAFLAFVTYNNFYYQPVISLSGREIDIEGIVEDSMQTDYGSKYQVNATVPFYHGTTPIKSSLHKRHKVRLTIYTFDELAANMGDTITCSIRIEKSEHISEISKGVLLHGFSTAPVIKRNDNLGIVPTLLRFRWDLINIAQRIYEPKARGLVESMVLGYRLDLDPDIKENINLSGAAHILAVSGLHVSIVFQIVLLIFQKLHLSRKFACITSIPFLIVFMGLTGFSASVLRSGIMLILSCFASILHRSYDAYTALGFAAIFILLQNPFYSVNIGFLMSFFSVLGILLFEKNIRKSFLSIIDLNRKNSLISRILDEKILDSGIYDNGIPDNQIINWVVQSISTSLAAYIFLTPIMIFSFGTLQLLSWLTTALILWLVSPIILLGLTSFIFYYFLTPGGFIVDLLTSIVELCCRGVVFFTSFLANTPVSVIYTKSISVLLLSVLIILSLLFIKLKGWNNKRVVSAILITGIILSNSNVIEYILNKDTLEIYSTNNALVLTKNGEAVVIGKIEDNYEAAEVALALRCRGINQMNLFISTETILDESEALDVLLKDIPAQKCVIPEKGKYIDFIIALKNLPSCFKLDNMSCRVFDNVFISLERVNDNYEVLIKYGNKKILKTTEKYDIILNKERLNAIYGEDNIPTLINTIDGVKFSYNASGERILTIRI